MEISWKKSKLNRAISRPGGQYTQTEAKEQSREKQTLFLVVDAGRSSWTATDAVFMCVRIAAQRADVECKEESSSRGTSG